MNYQIGMTANGKVEWEDNRVPETEMREALVGKLDIPIGLAVGSMDEAKKHGDRGVFVSDTHKIRIAGGQARRRTIE